MSKFDPGTVERSRRYRARLRHRLDALEAAVDELKDDLAPRIAQLEQKARRSKPKRAGDGQAAEA